MNKKIFQDVVAPPIVAFKEKARLLTPRVSHIFDMTQAVPSYPTFTKIRRRMQLFLEDEQASFYTDVPGLPALRSKIVGTHPLSNSMTDDNVLVTAGANHAMYTALTLLFNPGDKVLLLEPYYFNYDMAIKMLSLQPIYHPLSESDGFRMNADDVIRHAEEVGVRGTILVTPNNPTGACYEDEQLLRLLQWSSSAGVEILLDETYLRFVSQHLDDASIGSFLEKNLNVIGSFSKSFSLTGYRVGYLLASKLKIMESLKVQDTLVICAPHIAQLAALCGLDECSAEVAEKVAAITHLEQVLIEHCSRLKHFKLVSSGAYFAFVRHPFNHLSCEDACLKLYEHTGILGLPGTVFGGTMEPYIRLAFCNLTESELNLALNLLNTYDREMVE